MTKKLSAAPISSLKAEKADPIRDFPVAAGFSERLQKLLPGASQMTVASRRQKAENLREEFVQRPSADFGPYFALMQTQIHTLCANLADDGSHRKPEQDDTVGARLSRSENRGLGSATDPEMSIVR